MHAPAAMRAVIGRTARQSARGLLQGSTPCNTAKAAPAWPSGLPLPTSWDWSACGAITPVKSQGGVSCCLCLHAPKQQASDSMARLDTTAACCLPELRITVRQLLCICHGRRA